LTAVPHSIPTSPSQTARPDVAALEKLLDQYAPLAPLPNCPGVATFTARSLVEVWEVAERLAGGVLPAPFWAYPWAGGQALARVLIDRPAWVRDRRVMDFGAGGGVASIAAALAGASSVVANDIDAWALTTTGIAARRQGLHVETLLADLTEAPTFVDACDVLLCSELAYERSTARAQRAVIDHARRQGLHVLLADAGRTYFDAGEAIEIARFEILVPRDLEGTEERVARVFSLAP
jgi:predicted nicotinamide N-methyase